MSKFIYTGTMDTENGDIDTRIIELDAWEDNSDTMTAWVEATQLLCLLHDRVRGTAWDSDETEHDKYNEVYDMVSEDETRLYMDLKNANILSQKYNSDRERTWVLKYIEDDMTNAA